MTILIVENNDNIQSFLKYKLDNLGYIIHTAQNIKDSISHIVKYSIDLIILDLLLDGSGGKELLYYMKEHNLRIPVIVISKKFNEEEVQDLFELGIWDYILKPIHLDLLLIKINQFFNNLKNNP